MTGRPPFFVCLASLIMLPGVVPLYRQEITLEVRDHHPLGDGTAGQSQAADHQRRADLYQRATTARAAESEPADPARHEAQLQHQELMSEKT